ncbi:MAG: hypothetical protein LBD06_12495 [Candidatus Accumulibacter sp.]|nr:hypothetical protein [Accumulibacter sp.]
MPPSPGVAFRPEARKIGPWVSSVFRPLEFLSSDIEAMIDTPPSPGAAFRPEARKTGRWFSLSSVLSNFCPLIPTCRPL